MSGFDSILSLLAPEKEQIKVFVGSYELQLNPILVRLLSNEELAHASSFRFESDRIGFQTQRGLWRLAASAITGIDPAKVVIERDQFGRPFSQAVQSCNGDINVSRTKTACGIALSIDQPCGIDIEQVELALVDRQLVEMLPFDEAQIDEMIENPGLFYQIWTQIESVLKADGRGLTAKLDRAQYVDAISDVRTQWQIDSKTWLTESISTPSSVVGTVAFERVVTRVMQISEGEMEAALTTRILCA